MRARDFEGIDIDVEEDADEITVRAMTGRRQMGYAYFVKDGKDLLPQDLEIDPRYQGQGIARVLYDFLKSQGYSIRRSGQQTAAGTGFWQKHRPGQNIWEVNYPDELNISDQIQQYFFKRGYDLAGEGRDQMAFESPRGTIVKVLGIGEDEREQVVRRYV